MHDNDHDDGNGSGSDHHDKDNADGNKKVQKQLSCLKNALGGHHVYSKTGLLCFVNILTLNSLL